MKRKTKIALASVFGIALTSVVYGVGATQIGPYVGDGSVLTNITSSQVGLGNVTNESKATMFASPTFTGTVSGVTKTHVGLSNVTNVAQEPANANIQSHISSTADPHNVTQSQVGLGNVTNESKATMFASPTFTGIADFANGSIGAPSISFSSQGNTGFSRSIGNSIDVSANGSRAIRIDDGNTNFYNGRMNISAGGAITQFISDNLTSTPTLCSTNGGGNVGTITSCASTKRLKELEVDISDEDANKIYQTRPLKFKYIDKDIYDYGFFAEDIHELFPELTFNNADGRIGGLNYRHYTAILTKAVQTQKVKMDAMQTWICAQDNAPDELCEVN